MIDSVFLQNLETLDEVALVKTAGNPYLLETSGLDWGSVDAIHNKYSNLTGVGNIITSTKIDERIVTITGRVCSPHTIKEIMDVYGVYTVSEIAAKRLEEINAAKAHLSQIVNPLNVLRLRCGDYYIDGKAKTSLLFSKEWRENNEIYCKFTFQLECTDPMFHYKSIIETPISGVRGGFHFPLSIPSPNGMHFGNVISYQLISVVNNGDVTIGGIIHIKATGNVENPEIISVYSQKSLKLVKTLVEGEVVVIDTDKRTITGHLANQPSESYMRYFDFDSDWIMFEAGSNLIGYSADNESYKYVEIMIENNPSYYSIGEQ